MTNVILFPTTPKKPELVNLQDIQRACVHPATVAEIDRLLAKAAAIMSIMLDMPSPIDSLVHSVEETNVVAQNGDTVVNLIAVPPIRTAAHYWTAIMLRVDKEGRIWGVLAHSINCNRHYLVP